jgi:hypothetical protein
LAFFAPESREGREHDEEVQISREEVVKIAGTGHLGREGGSPVGVGEIFESRVFEDHSASNAAFNRGHGEGYVVQRGGESSAVTDIT